MTEPLDYDHLVRDFEQSLLTQLRGHGASGGFLEMWVPDEDPVRGLTGLFDAAELAGEETVVVSISQATLNDEQLLNLQSVAAVFGRLTVSRLEGAWTLRLDQIGLGAAFRSAPSAYRAALLERAGKLKHRTMEEGAPSEGLLARHDGFGLTATLHEDGETLAGASHFGPDDPVRQSLLDIFCDILPGLTVLEAADHGVHRLLTALSDGRSGRPVAGIALPGNADVLFSTPLALSRGLMTAWRAKTGRSDNDNRYATAPSDQWTGKSKAQRRTAIEAALSDLSKMTDYGAEAVKLIALEPNLQGNDVRAVVEFSAAVPPTHKPGLARQADAELKRRVEASLELYVVELKDSSGIRRL